MTPTSSGGAVTSYAVSPSLPIGLMLNMTTGVVSGAPLVAAAQADYTVTATNEGGTDTDVLTLTVTAPALSVTMQPSPTTVSAGATANFSATASGTGSLVYQWLKEGSSIGGAISSSYTTLVTTSADDGARYQLRVMDTFGSSIDSDAALLGVIGGRVQCRNCFAEWAGATDGDDVG
jgi:hypothetical protein